MTPEALTALDALHTTPARRYLDWRPEWNGLDEQAQARLKARQGVGNMIACLTWECGTPTGTSSCATAARR